MNRINMQWLYYSEIHTLVKTVVTHYNIKMQCKYGQTPFISGFVS